MRKNDLVTHIKNHILFEGNEKTLQRMTKKELEDYSEFLDVSLYEYIEE